MSSLRVEEFAHLFAQEWEASRTILEREISEDGSRLERRVLHQPHPRIRHVPHVRIEHLNKARGISPPPGCAQNVPVDSVMW